MRSWVGDALARLAQGSGITFLAGVVLAPAVITLVGVHRVGPTFGWTEASSLNAVELRSSVQYGILALAVAFALLAGTLAAYHIAAVRRTLHVVSFCILLEVFYRIAYGGPVSAGVLLSVGETSHRESWELIAGHPALSICLAGIASIGLVALMTSWNAPRRFAPTGCRRLGLAALVMATLSLAMAAHQQRSAAAVRDVALGQLASVFPVDLLHAAYAVGRADWNSHQNAAARAAFQFPNAHLIDTPLRGAARELYVVVIGETSRRRNWSLFGYARGTTPRLQALKGELLLFDRVTSNATNTIQSLPLTLSRADTSSMQRFYSEKSIVSLLRQAGLATAWISNQTPSQSATNSISQIASDADSVSFSDTGRGVESRDGLDSNLIDRLDAELARLSNDAKVVVFLHMEGSHFSYEARYPASAALFNDGDKPPRVLTENQAHVVNQYDNTIYFTDYVLDHLIDRVKHCGCQSGLMYFSDHGERLFDGGSTDPAFGHGFPSVARSEIEVPLLLYLSPEYRQHNADKIAALLQNVHVASELHNVFETLVDLAGVTYDGRAPELSLFSRHYRAPAARSILDVNQQVVSFPSEYDLTAREPMPPQY